MGIFRRLYQGDTAFPLIRRRRWFYSASGALCALALVSMLVQGFNKGVEFQGGTTFQFPANGHTVAQARELFQRKLGVTEPIVQELGRAAPGSKPDLRVQTAPLSVNQVTAAIEAIQVRFGITDEKQVNTSVVGATWGSQVTNKALRGLAIFLVAVVVYISIRFEPKMAMAAIIALLHDLILAAGIYSITQFVVTPGTVIALLTVLGYSLYDTIVVFDKVEENTQGLAGSSRSTYSEAAELAVNQTFMRSINTSIIALLPVSGLLFVGGFLLGAGTLKDLSLALFVGLAAGAYSSLFLATPLLSDLKEREPQYRALRNRVLARRAGTARLGRVAGAGTRAVSIPETGHAVARAVPPASSASRPETAPPPSPRPVGVPGAAQTPASRRREPAKRGSAGRRPSRRRGR